MMEPASFAPAYPIRTARFLLRPVDSSDVDALLAIYGDEDVARYLYEPPLSRAETEERLRRAANQTRVDPEHDALYLVGVDGRSASPFGVFTLAVTSREHLQGAIGYMINPQKQGRGFAVEGALEMLRIGFERLGLHRISASLDGRNIGSAKVAERVGMRMEAHLVENEWVKGEWVDELIYAMLASEWGDQRRV